MLAAQLIDSTTICIYFYNMKPYDWHKMDNKNCGEWKGLARIMSDKLQWYHWVRQFNAAFLSLNLDSVAN